MRKIGVIGLGHVGATLVHELLVGQVFDTYVLIDTKEEKLRADVLDFQDRVANTGQSARFILNDYSALADAEVVVSCLGKIDLQANKNQSRFGELPFTSEQVREVSQKLNVSGFAGVLVVVTNPCDVIAGLYQQETGFPSERVLGTGTLLDTARLKRAIGERLAISPVAISGYVLGEHGNSQFPAWSQVRVGEQAITELFDQDQLAEIAQEARQGGHTVFYGKGYTNFAIVAATKRLVEAIVTDKQDILPVSHYLPEYETYASYPAVIGRSGLVRRLSLDLTSEEEEALRKSTAVIRQELAALRNNS